MSPTNSLGEERLVYVFPNDVKCDLYEETFFKSEAIS